MLTFSLNEIVSIAADNVFRSTVKNSEYLKTSTSQFFSDWKTKSSFLEIGAFDKNSKFFVVFSSTSMISSKYCFSLSSLTSFFSFFVLPLYVYKINIIFLIKIEKKELNLKKRCKRIILLILKKIVKK